MLRTAVDRTVDPGIHDLLRDLLHRRVEKDLPLSFFLIERFLRRAVFVRIKIHEREVFQFALDGAHAETVRKRRVDFQRFLGNAHLFFTAAVGKRPHVVKSVSKFDDHDTDIGRYGQEQLPQVLDLFLLLGDILVFRGLGQFRNAVDKHSNALAEFMFDILKRHALAVLHRVMKDRCDDALRVHSEIQDDFRHLKRVRDIRLAGFAKLSVMVVDRKIDRFGKQLRLLGRIGCGKLID